MTAAEIEASDISWIEVDEVLLTTGMDYSRTFRMPLLDNHNTHSGIDSILGRVDNIRAEGGKIIGVGVFSDRHSWLVAEIERGFFGQISAGYCVHEYEIIEREHDVPLAIAVRWTLHETSVVPVGADPNATVRGERSFPLPSFRKRAADPNTQEKKMELEELVKAAESAVDAVVAAADEGASEEVVARAKALRKLRAEGDELIDEEDAARAEGDDALTATEEKEADDLEASARSLNKALGDQVAGMRKFRAKPAEIRAAVRKVLASGISTSATRSADLTPVKPAAKAPTPTLNSNEIFAKRAKWMGR
ncbi:hypothetical protein [Neorhizobium tomejilense]|uniref:hypothetical protein n=1 Tax=Neorhizobium tomejilense TaxID=2093828 RepID=UPI003ECFEBDA